MFISLVLLQLISAVSDKEMNIILKEQLGLSKQEILKSSYIKTDFELKKDGVLYSAKQEVTFPYGEGVIIFYLPEGMRYKSLEVYDLKTRDKDRLVRISNYSKLQDNCSGKYAINFIQNSSTIIVCPSIHDKEVEIGIEALLYNQEVPKEYKKTADYYFYFKDFVLPGKGYVTDNFEVDICVSADETEILINLKPEDINCSKLKGFNPYFINNGACCGGHPKVEEQSLHFNIGITGKDRYKEELRTQINYGVIWVAIISIIVAMFQNVLSNAGKFIYRTIICPIIKF